jgi:Ca2+-binding EF-hand superfamily protein
MTRITRCLIPGALAIATAVAAATVLAGPSDSDAAATPKQSRTVDVAKMQARAEQVFTAADTDSDGTISRAEFAAAKRPHEGMRHRRHGPGLGPEQHAAMQAELFKALDTDGNGVVSAEEFAQIGAKTEALMRNHAFDRMDANGDGVLDKTEFPPFASRAEQLDTDGDGIVTKDEMRAGRGGYR